MYEEVGGKNKMRYLQGWLLNTEVPKVRVASTQVSFETLFGKPSEPRYIVRMEGREKLGNSKKTSEL